MKKRMAGVLLVATLAVSQTVCVYGAGSITTRPQIAAPDKTEADSIFTRVETVGPEEESAVVVNGTRVSFMTGTAAIAGLSDATVETIRAINSAKTQLSDVVKDVDLTGFAALTAVQSVVTKDQENQNIRIGNVTLNLYVPNMVEGSGTIQILFYNNATGRWELIVPEKINYSTKQITVKISGSGSFSVIYKK